MVVRRRFRKAVERKFTWVRIPPPPPQMENQLDIIKLPPSRWAELKELRLTSLQTDPDAWENTYTSASLYSDELWKSRLQTSWDDQGCTNFFAEVNGKIVGTVGAIWSGGKLAHVATIVSVYVLPEYRRQGISEALMSHITNYLQDKKFIKLKLFVVSSQTNAYEFYKKLGFKEVGRLEKELLSEGKYSDEIIMERFLDE